MKDRLTSLHLYAEDGFRRDYDYTYFFLWLAEALAQKFLIDEIPLKSKLVQDVANWFADVSLEDAKQVKSEVAVETEASAEGKTGIYWFSLKLLARLKSTVQGSVERRQEIKL